MADIWTSIDPLGEALQSLHMKAVLCCRSELRAPWAIEMPPLKSCMMLHVVTSGQCWVEVDGAVPTLWKPGDMALVPRGRGHRLVGKRGFPSVELLDLPQERVSDRYTILRHGGNGALTTMLCGVMRFQGAAADHVIRLLPPVIRVDDWNSPESEWIRSTLRLVTVEAQTMRAGAETVLTRLADIFIVQAIRAWFASDSVSGWGRAFRDKQMAHAISRIHRDPTRNWTVASLAAEVGMSRSAFAARFTHLVGQSAMQYATHCKMQAADTLLREGSDSLAEIAARLGYKSEAAFSRAFKRAVGVSPGAVRRGERTDQQTAHAGMAAGAEPAAAHVTAAHPELRKAS